MYLHIGQEYSVKTRDIVGVFDLENTTVSANTRAFLTAAEKHGQVVNTAPDLPKTFVVCTDKRKQHTVYLSQLATTTLQRRNQTER